MLLQRMNWSYVTTVAMETTEDEGALEAFTHAAMQGGICISSSHRFSLESSNEDMEHLINNITSNQSAKVAIVFASSSGSKKLLATIQQTGDTAMGFQFVVNHKAVLGITPNVTRLRGIFGFRIPLPTSEDDFDDYFKQLTPDKVNPVHNPWFADYWQRKYKCNLNGSGRYMLTRII